MEGDEGAAVLDPGLGLPTDFAYNIISREWRTWKRYRGGMATDIWIYDLREDSAERVTDWEGTDTEPMWIGDKIYFTSDRDGRNNIYAYDTTTKATRQLTEHDPSLVVGIYGGAVGTTRDTFELLRRGHEHGARVALFGRKIHTPNINAKGPHAGFAARAAIKALKWRPRSSKSVYWSKLVHAGASSSTSPAARRLSPVGRIARPARVSATAQQSLLGSSACNSRPCQLPGTRNS